MCTDTHTTLGTVGGIGGATDSEKARKEEHVAAGIPYVRDTTPPFLRGYPTYACGLLQEVHAGIIPITQARHRPSLTGTTASPGSKTGKMESCVRAPGVSQLGPWLHPDLPCGLWRGVCWCHWVRMWRGTACRKRMSRRRPRALPV